jgi:hypothetical protein
MMSSRILNNSLSKKYRLTFITLLGLIGSAFFIITLAVLIHYEDNLNTFTLYSSEIIESQFVIDKVYLVVETLLMQAVYT